MRNPQQALAGILILPLWGITAGNVSGQAMPPIQWQHALGGSGSEEGACIAQTADGGYLLTGNTNSSDGEVSGVQGGKDLWVVRLNATGALVWQTALGGTADDEGRALAPTSDGGCIVTGYTASSDGDVSGQHGERDLWAVKLNAEGAMEWQRALGGSGSDQGFAVMETDAQEYVLAGESTSTDGDVSGTHGMWDVWVVKLAQDGTLLWQHAYGGTENDWANGIAAATGGGYLLAGSTASPNGDVVGLHGGQDAWVLKLDNAGALLWQRTLGSEYLEAGNAIVEADNGDVLMAGTTMATQDDPPVYADNGDYWVVRLNAAGEDVWKHSYNAYGYEVANSIANTGDGGFIILGSTFISFAVNGHEGYDPLLVHIDGMGAEQWRGLLGGTSNWDYGHGVQQTSDGGYIAIASVWSTDGEVENNHGGGDAWVVKLHDVNAGLAEATAPGISLSPNPGAGNINLRIEQAFTQGFATMYDLQGAAIGERHSLVQGGNIIHGKGLSTGTYLLRIELDGSTEERRVVIEGR